MDLLDVSLTITFDYNSSHIEILDNESLIVFWISDWSLVSRILYLDVWTSDWTNFMRTEYRTPSQTVYCSLLFSVATKRVTISGQHINFHKRIRCRGNVFQLAIV
jgi:hypothetical protein